MLRDSHSGIFVIHYSDFFAVEDCHSSCMLCSYWSNWFSLLQCFPGSSSGKESTCYVGDPGLIHGSGRSPREGIGYPLQYSWTSLVAQMVKKLPTMWETRVWSLAWEDTLEEGMATHCSILAWAIPWTEEPGGLQSMGVAKSDTTDGLTVSLSHIYSQYTTTWTKHLTGNSHLKCRVCQVMDR